ncbi:hypothetical protein AX14_008038 [Amanita brunnescens Koide BX004]|nr:hypothetical protein AX14_008038 [Amanita brunnescens Koide BX004]
MSATEQSIIAAQFEGHDAIVDSSAVAVTSATLDRLTFFTTILTLGMPAFHASLATKVTNSALDLKAAVRAWEAVRNFNSGLLASLVAALFKESTHAIYWFFIACSLLQASMGLVYATILIICFSGHLEHDGYSVDVDKLTFSFWTIWDLFSLPAIWTVWAALTFIIALIVDAVAPNIVQHECAGSNHDSLFTAAKVMLSLFICLAAVRFGFFMLHLRRVYQARLDRPHGATQS